MMQNQRVAFCISLALHAVLLGLILSNLNFASPKRPQFVSDVSPEPVRAIALDQHKVEQQIHAIKAAESRKKLAEDQRLKQLQQQAKQATQQAAAEKKRLAQLTENRRKQKLEQQKQAEQAKQKIEKMQLEQAAEAKRLAQLKKQRENEELEKQMRQEEAELLAKQLKAEEQQLAAAKKQQQQTEIDKYTALITHAIGRHWIQPDTVADEISCVLLIRLGQTGDVEKVSLVSSSGDSVLDRSAIAAVNKASPLPVPEDPELLVKFREIRLKVKPEGYLL